MNKRVINYIIQSKLYRVRELKNGKERTVGSFRNLRDAKICQAGHHWIDGKAPNLSYFGFVYLVTDKLTDMKYVGKKQFFFYNGECDSANDVRNSDWDPDCWRESDWRYYKTSSKVLAPIIKQRPHDFTFKILGHSHSKLDLHLLEIRYQKNLDVLNAKLPNGDREYYNQNIASCEFNVHESGEGARAVRYSASYQAWADMMRTFDVCSEWKDYRKFLKDNRRKLEACEKPIITTQEGTNVDPFNIAIIDIGEKKIPSSKYDHVYYENGVWTGYLYGNPVAYGIGEREAAANLDDKVASLGIERQVKWV